MAEAPCIAFLQWALPRLGLRWPGFRSVHKLVCKRLGQRLRELGLRDLAAYRNRLEGDPGEWREFDALCWIPISRFYRDRSVFEALERDVLPALSAAAAAEGRDRLACWSACCASGEEPLTLAILWRLRLGQPFPRLRVLATDIDPQVLDRGRAGCYRASSLKALPAELLAEAFESREAHWYVREEFRCVEFRQQDIRESVPEEKFDLVLCRNAVLTYFAPELQGEVMARVAATLRPGGALVIGIHENLPDGLAGFEPWNGERAVYRKLRNA